MKAILIFLSVCLFFAFSGSEKMIFQKPKFWPEPQYDFRKNPLSQAKIELGKALFYDPILSRDKTISCASCHLSYTAFTHVDHALSHGIADKIGNRNSPALMNLAWGKSFMWDGSINHLDMQALAPISNPLEMDEKIENVVLKLKKSDLYPSLFAKAYGDSSVTGERTLKAISQFLLTLVSANSKYDSVMRKETEFTNQEKVGYALFQKNCNSCHVEPLFTNNAFENNGLALDTGLKDFGKMAISHKLSDSLKFKVPTLRNVQFSFPYMHDGRFKKLKHVLNHYTSGIQKGPTLSKHLEKPISLSADEKADLIAFLFTLSDKTFLFDPKHAFPKEILSRN
jgi:cytochrome c peroxidase